MSRVARYLAAFIGSSTLFELHDTGDVGLTHPDMLRSADDTPAVELNF